MFKGNQIVMPGCTEKKGQEQCSFNLFLYFLMFEIVQVCKFLVFRCIGKRHEEDAQGTQISELDR